MDILADLRKNICEVTFTKANGDERTMLCTLIPDFLPQPEATSSIQPKKVKDDLVTVWDLEENSWRSFKPSRIIDVQFSK